MANEEHLKRLKEAIEKKNIEIWNKWLAENPEKAPDLRKANLCDADLSGEILRGADFFKANLRGANLRGADLCDANLRGADLSGADLTKAGLAFANLRKADLIKANLRGADLIKANLRRADLCDADLSRAILRGADLTKAGLIETNLYGAYFEAVIGLPSQIRSARNWKKAFYGPEMLKSLGLPPDHNEKLRKEIEEKQQQ